MNFIISLFALDDDTVKTLLIEENSNWGFINGRYNGSDLKNNIRKVFSKKTGTEFPHIQLFNFECQGRIILYGYLNSIDEIPEKNNLLWFPVSTLSSDRFHHTLSKIGNNMNDITSFIKDYEIYVHSGLDHVLKDIKQKKTPVTRDYLVLYGKIKPAFY